MLLSYTLFAITLCVSQVFGQQQEVGATPDVLALMNRMNTCRYQTVMCCYSRRRVQNGGGRPADNTNVCRAQGFATAYEGATHCHGFTWAGTDGQMSDADKRRLLDYVNTQDHFGRRGYYGAIGGYNKCDCVENMPVVTRSDCSELNGAANPKACDPKVNGRKRGKGNNLRDKYESLGGNSALFTVNLVESCSRAPKNPPPLPDGGNGTPPAPAPVPPPPVTPPPPATEPDSPPPPPVTPPPPVPPPPVNPPASSTAGPVSTAVSSAAPPTITYVVPPPPASSTVGPVSTVVSSSAAPPPVTSYVVPPPASSTVGPVSTVVSSSAAPPPVTSYVAPPPVASSTAAPVTSAPVTTATRIPDSNSSTRCPSETRTPTY